MSLKAVFKLSFYMNVTFIVSIRYTKIVLIFHPYVIHIHAKHPARIFVTNYIIILLDTQYFTNLMLGALLHVKNRKSVQIREWTELKFLNHLSKFHRFERCCPRYRITHKAFIES